MSITTTPYGFIPTQVSGLVLWLDASDPTTITQSSGNITQWRDKSTSALTATGVSNPQYVTNVQNGFPGISFDGSTQYFNLGNNLNMGTNQIYIFIVSKFNSTADGAIIGKSLLGSQGGRYSLLRVGALVPLIEAGGGAVNNSGLNSDTSTSARLLNMVWDRSTINLYQNGSSVFSVGLSDSSNLTTGNSLLIGAYQNGSGGVPPVAGLYMNGYIHEILMYFTSTASPLGNTARQQIESYLAQKWGLTLGAGHPGLTSTVYRSTYLKNSAVKRNIATMTPFFAAFSPRQIGGLALWLDSTDSSTISFSSGSNVSTWSDKSGNGRNATVYAGTPTYTSALGMTFNGSSSLQITYTASPILESMFVIIKFNSVSGQGDILSGTAAGQREYLMYVPYSPGTIYLGRHSTGPSGAINGGTVTTGSNYLLGYVFNGTGNTISFFQSGNTITSGTPQFTYSAGGTISVIGSYNGGGYLQGQIYEMIIYSTALSITERQRVESYLAQKWGLTSSLPGGHLHLTQPAGARTALSLANSKMSIISRRITAFTSFRWTITAGNTDQWVQFSEFQVGNNNSQVVFVSQTTATTGSTISWNTGNGEGPVQVVDNNLNTKGLGIGTSGLVLIVTVSTPITANMYRWASANDSTPSRNPTQWTVDGSADGVTFVRLHTQNTTYAGPNTTFTYTSWINFTY